MCSEYSKEKVLNVFKQSELLNVKEGEGEDKYPTFHKSELVLNKVLGEGAFGIVKEITGVKLHDDQSNLDIITEPVLSQTKRFNEQNREFIAKHCIREGSRDARYAVKILSDKVISDPKILDQAIMDLVIEVRFLSIIEHPNIIKMRGTAQADPFSSGNFIVLDRLYDTLEQRIFGPWKREENNFLKKLLDSKGKRRKKLLAERLFVADELASALHYLHDRRIIYRDLKPENVGFDVRGDVKIFDFGLGKVLPPPEHTDELYKLTGYTGSIRFMAPEVAKSLPYNLKADVFSFGIMLWEMCALQEPFKNFNIKMHSDLVVNRGFRPKIRSTWPEFLQNLLQQCWSVDIQKRPNFFHVGEVLNEGIASLGREQKNEFRDISRRRSTYLMASPKPAKWKSTISPGLSKKQLDA